MNQLLLLLKAPPMSSMKNGNNQTRTAIELARKAVELKKKQDRIEDIIGRFEAAKSVDQLLERFVMNLMIKT